MDNREEELRCNEQALLDPIVRRDRALLQSLLAEDFIEFGSSGRVWTRDQIIDLLETENAPQIAIENFDCAFLSADAALITYFAVRTDPQSGNRIASLRSSVWIRKQKAWRLRFHQGTRIP